MWVNLFGRISLFFILVLSLWVFQNETFAAPFDPWFCATVTDVPVTECENLELFYNTLHGSLWTTSTNWGTNALVSTWYGITVTGWNVTNIVLSANNLSGSIAPLSFSWLTDLVTLYLNENAISGNFQPWIFSGLTNLTTISIFNNDLSWTPLAGVFSGLTSLITLDLNQNNFSWVLPVDLFAWLTNLQSINFFSNQLSGILPAGIFSWLTNLNGIYFGSNQLLGPLPSNIFTVAPNLRDIILDNNSITGPLPNMFSWTWRINIVWNLFHFEEMGKILSIVPPSGRLYAPQWYTGVTTVFDGIHLVVQNEGNAGTGMMIYEWHTATWLLVATLTGTNTWTPPMGGTYYPVVKNTLLTDTSDPDRNFFLTGSSYTYTMPFVSGFCATVTDVPQSECEVLEAFYTATNGSWWTNHSWWWVDTTVDNWVGVTVGTGHVTIVQLVGNNLSGSLSGLSFSLLPQLQELRLPFNTLNGPLPVNLLTGLTELKVFNVFNNLGISGTLPPTLFSGLINLNTIALSHNQISGTLPPTLLSGLTNLVDFEAADNLLTGPIPSDFFTGLTNIASVYLYENLLTGPFPILPWTITTCVIQNNALNFDGLEHILPVAIRQYDLQANFNLIHVGSGFDAQNAWLAGTGTMKYEWYDLTDTLIATITGSSLWSPLMTGSYYVKVSNDALPDLILRSNTLSVSSDTSAPIVSLSGASALTLTLGQTFIDPGASWTDDVDGSWNTFTGSYGSTGSFAVNGSVNTWTVWSYVLTYKKVDMSWKSGSVIRTVTIHTAASSWGGGWGGGGPGGGSSSPAIVILSWVTASGLTPSTTPPVTVTTWGLTPKPTLPYPDISLFSKKQYCATGASWDVMNLFDPRLDPYYREFSLEKWSSTPTTRAMFLKIVLDFAWVDLSSEQPLTHIRYYPDVMPNAWYRPYINYATRHGIVSWNLDGMFRPNAQITRAEATKVFIHILSETWVPYRNIFLDVSSSHTLAPFIQAAYDFCFIHGKREWIFVPEEGITGPETLKILYNMKY